MYGFIIFKYERVLIVLYAADVVTLVNHSVHHQHPTRSINPGKSTLEY